jgi:hypothetical protein
MEQYEHKDRPVETTVLKAKPRDDVDRQVDALKLQLDEQATQIRRLQKDIARLNESINILSRR